MRPALVVLVGCSDSTAPRQFDVCRDACRGSMIDATRWSYAGTMAEAGGVLTLGRDLVDVGGHALLRRASGRRSAWWPHRDPTRSFASTPLELPRA